MFDSAGSAFARRRKNRAARRALEKLTGVERFQRELRRERARSDRTGEVFSLLVYRHRAASAPQAAFGPLAAALLGRLRVTDEVGWLDGARLGVLLPCTPGPGAWKVVEDIARATGQDGAAFSVTVFSYPSPPDDSDSDAGADSLPERPEKEKANHVHAMEVLFIQRLPAWKRCVDVFGAVVGLVVLLPLLVAIAALVKITSRGPVLFCQRRAGLGGKPFVLYKFRTMVADADGRKKGLLGRNQQDGPAFKIRDDPRVTRLGRILRKLSLDELPQLWNVLRGEMSLVGPRPLPCEEAAACAGWQRQRQDVTPGLTCIWQVRGRNSVSFSEWVRMDVEYIRSRSWKTDLALLLRTVPAVLFGKGAS